MKSTIYPEWNLEISEILDWDKPYNKIVVPKGWRKIKVWELWRLLESKHRDKFLGEYKGEYNVFWCEQTEYDKAQGHARWLYLYSYLNLGSDGGSLVYWGAVGRVCYTREIDKSRILLFNTNKVALIDEEDYLRVSKYKWYLAKRRRKSEYAYNEEGIMLHKLLLPCDSNLEIDHINGNGLDNRRSNLRIVTHSQNMMNARKRDNTTSMYKGVSWNVHHKKWKAELTLNGKTRFIGYYDHEVDAAKAYNKNAKKEFGEYAKLNVVREVKR